MSFRWRSSSVTDAGKRRLMNEDAFFTSVNAGIWLVADGMGGHLHGDVASQAITEAFKDIEKGSNLDDMISESRDRLTRANQTVQRLAVEAGGTMGSTVVVLVLLPQSLNPIL